MVFDKESAFGDIILALNLPRSVDKSISISA